MSLKKLFKNTGSLVLVVLFALPQVALADKQMSAAEVSKHGYKEVTTTRSLDLQRRSHNRRTKFQLAVTAAFFLSVFAIFKSQKYGGRDKTVEHYKGAISEKVQDLRESAVKSLQEEDGRAKVSRDNVEDPSVERNQMGLDENGNLIVDSSNLNWPASLAELPDDLSYFYDNINERIQNVVARPYSSSQVALRNYEEQTAFLRQAMELAIESFRKDIWWSGEVSEHELRVAHWLGKEPAKSSSLLARTPVPNLHQAILMPKIDPALEEEQYFEPRPCMNYSKLYGFAVLKEGQSGERGLRAIACRRVIDIAFSNDRDYDQALDIAAKLYQHILLVNRKFSRERATELLSLEEDGAFLPSSVGPEDNPIGSEIQFNLLSSGN